MYRWHDLVGNIGVVCILGSYLLLQLGKIDSRSLRFSLFNGAGAALIIVSLVHEFNFSAFVIEAFWLVISLLGVARWLLARRRGRRRA